MDGAGTSTACTRNSVPGGTSADLNRSNTNADGSRRRTISSLSARSSAARRSVTQPAIRSDAAALSNPERDQRSNASDPPTPGDGRDPARHMRINCRHASPENARPVSQDPGQLAAKRCVAGAAPLRIRGHHSLLTHCIVVGSWSGRWGSNPRHSAWEADVLPLNYARPPADCQRSQTCATRNDPAKPAIVHAPGLIQ